MTEDLLRLIKDGLSEVQKETEQKVSDKVFTWPEHYNNWIDFTQPIIKNVSEFERKNSFIILRLIEMQNLILWVWFATMCGRYHSAIRELRYILDSFLQAYWLDTNHPDSKLALKFEILSKNEMALYGGKLIEKLGVPQDKKEHIKILYRELSKYSHSSVKELIGDTQGVDHRITFAFNQELFELTENLRIKRWT